MDYISNPIEIVPDTNANLRPTKAINRTWTAECNSNYARKSIIHQDRHLRTHDESEQPPSKRCRVDRDVEKDYSGMTLSQEIGRMFFKTKLCAKFRSGYCSNETSCNYAHGIEELRRPPPNWQEIIAVRGEAPEKHEERHTPITTASNIGGEVGERPHKLRHCRWFYTDEGCPYGNACVYLHEIKARESVTINLSPTASGAKPVYNAGGGANAVSPKPMNWKTKICKKWELTGYCPFGVKCLFAHGNAELNRSRDGRESSSSTDSKHIGLKGLADVSGTSGSLHSGVSSLRARGAAPNQSATKQHQQTWKGPDKMNRIYGDWIDEPE